VNKISQFGMPK